MKTVPQITSYCLDWHTTNSDAFKDMLVEPLKPFADIKLTAWDGEHITAKTDPKSPLIFSMLPPPSALLKEKGRRLVWLPMWDQAQGYDQDWWNKLPKSLRIVAFSDVVYKKAVAAGLPVLRITYYKDPSKFEPVSWKNGRIVFYWNRVGMIGPEFLENLCKTIRPKELLFLGKNDPRIEENKFYNLPKQIGSTKVKMIEAADRETFLSKTSSANILIAPRLTEGVGMTFLESMARGGVVFANNAPTMNEYIQHGKNGILLDNTYHSTSDKIKARLHKTSLDNNNDAPYLLSAKQPWSKMKHLDFKKIGDRALADHIAGYKVWQNDIKGYADFVLNW